MIVLRRIRVCVVTLWWLRKILYSVVCGPGVESLHDLARAKDTCRCGACEFPAMLVKWQWSKHPSKHPSCLHN